MGSEKIAMTEHVTITKGTCFALFAYDVGLSINLTDAERRIIAGTERGRLRHKTRAPPSVLRVSSGSLAARSGRKCVRRQSVSGQSDC